MKIGRIIVGVSDCITGIYLRWWFNGWHYFNFTNGFEISMVTESMGVQVTNFFSVISKTERDTRIKSQYSYKVTVEGITPLNITGFTGLLLAEKVEQYELGTWREVEITRGDHLIKNEHEDSYILDFEVTRKEIPDSSSVYQKSLKLYLGDTLCDMDDEEVVPVNKQVNDIAEMQDRQSDFTATFKIRKTRAMKALFELSGEVGASTTFPYENQSCKLIQDNIEIVTAGYLVLDKVDDQYYYVSILSGNVNFFKLIEGKKLSDLTLADTVHNWNAVFMAATHAITSPGIDVVYPLCEPSDDGSMCPWTDPVPGGGDYVELYGGWIWPFIRLKTIWDEIFLNAGFTVTGGDLLSSDTFLKLYMPIAKRSITNTDKFLYSMSWYGARLSINNDELGNYDFPGTLLFNGDARFLSGYYDVPYAAKYTIHVYVISANIPTLSLYNHAAYQGTFTVTSWSIAWANFEYEFNGVPGDELSILTNSVYYYSFSVAITKIQDALIAYGSDVYPNLYLPDMTQTEFIKLICHLFALVPDVTPKDREIRFWNYDELYDNIPMARNWSNYLSERDDETEFKYGDYGQENYLKYKESKDVLEDNGKGSMDINDATLPAEKDIVKLSVATCDEVTILTNNYSVDVSRIGFNKWNESTSLYEANKTIDPRIVYIDFVKEIASPPYQKSLWIRESQVPLTGDFGVTSHEIVTPKKASSLEVSFSSLVVNYASLSRLLTKTNLRRAKFNLPVYEVAGLKHNIPIYLSQYKAYFYVNKINNYVAGKLCTVDLIRL